MHFLADLNAITYIFTVAAVAITVVCLGLLWVSFDGKWEATSGGILALPMMLAVFASIQAYEAYCPDADQPHVQRTGVLVTFRNYHYRTHRATRTGVLACVGACGGNVPLMELSEPILTSLDEVDKSQALMVTYLGRKEPADLGNGYSITAHPVVEIRNPSSGEQVFYIDTARHWPRVILLVFDALSSAFVVVFCISRTENNSGPEDSSSDDDGESDEREQSASTGEDFNEVGLKLDRKTKK